MVICLERGADLHMAQLMLLPLTVSCFTKIQIGFSFLVPAHPDSPRQRPVKRMCVPLSCNICSQNYYYTTPIEWPLFRDNRYQKGKTTLDLNEARDDGVWRWQWHQLDHIQTICTPLQTDNHASTQPLSFLQAGCPSCRPTNSVDALKAA